MPSAGKATFWFDPLNPIVVPVLTEYKFNFDSSSPRPIRVIKKPFNVNNGMNLARTVSRGKILNVGKLRLCIQPLVNPLIDTSLVVRVFTASEPSHLNRRAGDDLNLDRDSVLKDRRIAQVRW